MIYYQIGDLVRLNSDIVEVIFPFFMDAEEKNQVLVVRMPNGKTAPVRADMVELVEQVSDS